MVNSSHGMVATDEVKQDFLYAAEKGEEQLSRL